MRLKHLLSVFLTLLTLSVGQMWGATSESITANNAVYSGSGTTGIHTWNMTSCTVVQAKGTSNTSVNNSYPNRWYQNNTITFTPKSGYTISKIELTGSSADYNGQSMSLTTSAGSLSTNSNKTTWTGSTTSAITIRLGKQFRFGSVSITYTAAAPSYTVYWTINPAAGGTLSATSGTSTTVTPNSAYTYGSPAYTVTTGTASVSQSTNTFTATPSANCTIRINMVEKPKYTITYNAGSGSCATSTWTQTNVGQSTTLPTATTTCTGWTFAGWCTSPAGDAEDNSTSPGTILTGSYTPTDDVELFAVYTRTGEGSGNDEGYYVTRSLTAGKTYIFGAVKAAASSTLASNTTFGAVAFTNTYNSTSPNWGQKVDLTPNSSGYIAADNNSITAACLWTLESINNGNYSFKNGSNYIYLGTSAGSTTVGAQSGVSTSGNMYLEEVNSTCKDAFLCHPTSNSTNIMLYNTSNGYRMYASRTYSNTMTPYVRFYEYDPGTPTYYMTTLECCTELAQINGSFNFSNVGTTGATANWEWTGATTGISKNVLKVYKESDNSLATTIDNISASATSQAITGLQPCTQYYVKLTTVSSNGTYCEGVADQAGASHVTFTTGSYSVNYDGCSGVTKTAGATTACASGDFVATFTGQTAAYELPDDVSVTIGGVAQEKGTGYSWSVSDGVGTLTITAAKQTGNIVIDVDASLVGCVADPTIGTASLSGTFSSSAVGVTVTGCSTGANTCAWTDYGFVWGTSANPTGNKTPIGNEGSATSWNGSLTGTFAADQTYYFRAYGQNSKNEASVVYGADATFTPRSVTFKDGSSTLSTVLVNSGTVVAQPANPSKIGYDFVEWQLSGSAYDFASAVNSSIELQATWDKQEYTITKTFTGCTASSMPASYEYTGSGSDFTYTIAADDNYVLPTTITVTMGGEALTANTDYTWNSENGELAISKIITGDLVITVTADHLNTVTLKDRNNTLTQTTVGGNVELPTRKSCTGYTFAGWSTTYNANWTTTAPTIIPAGDYVPTADVDLYPVYTKTDVTPGTPTTITLTNSQIQSGRNNSNNYSDAYNIEGWTGKYAVNLSSTNYALQIGRNTDSSKGAYNSHLSTPSVSGGITSITITPHTSYSTAEGRTFYLMDVDDLNYTAASNQTGTYGSGACASANGEVTISVTGAPSQFHIYADGTAYIHSLSLTYVTSGSSTTSYISVSECCDELATLDGGVTLTNEGCAAGELKATWKSNSEGLAGIASQVLHIYKSDDTEVTAKKVTDITASTEDHTETISGLETCTAYYVTVENISAGSYWCTSGLAGEKSANVTTKGYTYSFTLTDDHVTKKSGGANANTCAGNYEAIYEAITGWALPSTISVINAGALNNGYTWNQTTGALVIDASKVTGDVTVTITAIEAPCTPLTAPTVSVSGKDTYPYNVTLSWDAITDADGYEVYLKVKGAESNVDEELLTTADEVNGVYFITFNGLEHSTEYTYTVIATSNTPAVHCNSIAATADFETADYPTVKLYYSENGELSAGVSEKILTDIELDEPTSDPCEKKFVGWSTVTVAETDDAPSMMQPGDTYQIPTNANCTIYAVYANVTPGPATWDEITTVPTEGTYAICAETYALKASINSGRFENGTIEIEDGHLTSAPEASCIWELSINNAGKFLLKNGTNYAAGTTAKNKGALVTDATDAHAQWEITYETDKFVVKNVGRPSDSDTPANAYLRQNGTSGWACYSATQTNAPRFFKRNPGVDIVSGGYATTCAEAPTATPSPTVLTDVAAAGASGTITMAYENVNTGAVSVGLFSNEACTEAFSGEWLTASLNDDKNITYTIAENTSYNDARSAYIKLTAPETNGATDPAIVKIPVSQVKKAAVFASLQDLVAADVNSGTSVTVSFSDVIIDSKVSNGIYFAIQKENANIEIYYASETVPAGWQAGGSVSGTMTCQWKRFVQSNVFKCWELQPANNSWAWEAPTGLTYAAPKTVSSIAIKAGSEPTQKTYADGATLDPTGMTVTFTYSDTKTKDITSIDPEWANIEWTFYPAILSEGTDVTVSVTAEYNNISSAAFEVTGITVTGIPTLTTQEFIEAGGARCYLEGIMGEIKNTTYGNFDLTDASGSIYIYGCLPSAGQTGQFASLIETYELKEGDKIKVLAETYTYYNKDEAVDVIFVEKLPQSVESVELDITEKTIKVGQNFTLTETVNPVGADNKSVTWTSSNNNIATVANGVVTGVGAGSATITVTTVDGGKTATCAVTVLATHSVTYNTSGSTGTTPVDAKTYVEGDEVTLASASGLSNAGYFFKEWVATYVDGNSDTQTLDIEDNKFTMPAFDVTVTATWARKSNDKWIKVTEASQLVADREYVIANVDATYALGEQRTNNRQATAVEENNSILTISDAVAIFTLGIPETGKYTFKNGGKYLYASSSSKNYLNEQASNDANGVWTISMNGEGEATVTATGTNTRNIMRYNPNNDNPVFSCYASNSSVQNPVVLYYKAPKIEINDGQTVNVSDAEGADIVIHNGGKLTVDAAKSVGDLTIETGGNVTLSSNKLTVVGKFTIETTMASGASGQLNGATASNFEASEAYIDITLGANGTNQQWHAFTVPFPVDVMNGIYDLDNNKLDNEVNYAIMEYFGDERAKGNYGWKKIRTTLVPGTFYIMATDGYRTTYRFKKKAGAALVAANSKSLSEYPIDGGEEDKDNGWNGVGNPTLMYGKINYNAYVLDPDIYDYVAKPANTVNFVVGTPFFIQADASGSVSMLTADAGANYAPARVKATEITNVDVTFGNDVYTDHLYISASEDALNEYQIGKDLVKMTMSNTPRVGRIFSNAYGHQLTMVYAPLSNNQAVYDLSLYAPQAGTYSIAVPNDVDATIYLTYEGSIIWDLTASAYEIDLTKGTTEGYGLILRTNAPSVVTGVDQIDAKADVQKVIIDEHVYILRGGQMYDVNGKMVK